MGNMDPSELLDIYQTGFRCCMILTILSIAAAAFIFFRKDIRSILMKKTGIGRRNAISRMRERNTQDDGRRAGDVDLEFNNTEYTDVGGVPADRSAEILGKMSGDVSSQRKDGTPSIKSRSALKRKRARSVPREVSETVPLSDEVKTALKEEAETVLLNNGSDEQKADAALPGQDTDKQTGKTQPVYQGMDALSDTVPLTRKKEDVLREEAETALLSQDTKEQLAETALLSDNDTDEKNTALHEWDAVVSEEVETVLLTHDEEADEGSAETVLLKKDSRPSEEKKRSGFVISERILVVHTDEEIGV